EPASVCRRGSTRLYRDPIGTVHRLDRPRPELGSALADATAQVTNGRVTNGRVTNGRVTRVTSDTRHPVDSPIAVIRRNAHARGHVLPSPCARNTQPGTTPARLAAYRETLHGPRTASALLFRRTGRPHRTEKSHPPFRCHRPLGRRTVRAVRRMGTRRTGRQ